MDGRRVARVKIQRLLPLASATPPGESPSMSSQPVTAAKSKPETKPS
jgi:hypothetical protein